MSRIYAAEHPSASGKWYSPIVSALSSVLCCFQTSAKKSESRTRLGDRPVSRPGLHRRICMIASIVSLKLSRVVMSDGARQRGC